MRTRRTKFLERSKKQGEFIADFSLASAGSRYKLEVENQDVA